MLQKCSIYPVCLIKKVWITTVKLLFVQWIGLACVVVRPIWLRVKKVDLMNMELSAHS